jgi:hypothetical protein
MARDKKTEIGIQEPINFAVNDKIRMVSGQQIYEGYVIKTDAKSKTPIVVCLVDHLGSEEREFCRMVGPEEIEMIKVKE